MESGLRYVERRRMTLSDIIAQAQRLAQTDKGLAYYYLLGILQRADGQEPDDAA